MNLRTLRISETVSPSLTKIRCYSSLIRYPIRDGMSVDLSEDPVPARRDQPQRPLHQQTMEVSKTGLAIRIRSFSQTTARMAFEVLASDGPKRFVLPSRGRLQCRSPCNTQEFKIRKDSLMVVADRANEAPPSFGSLSMRNISIRLISASVPYRMIW